MPGCSAGWRLTVQMFPVLLSQNVALVAIVSHAAILDTVWETIFPHNVFMTIEPKKVNLPAKWMKAHRVQGYNKQLAARLLSVNTS